jgi:hypothetical protein
VIMRRTWSFSSTDRHEVFVDPLAFTPRRFTSDYMISSENNPGQNGSFCIGFS